MQKAPSCPTSGQQAAASSRSSAHHRLSSLLETPSQASETGDAKRAHLRARRETSMMPPSALVSASQLFQPRRYEIKVGGMVFLQEALSRLRRLVSNSPRIDDDESRGSIIQALNLIESTHSGDEPSYRKAIFSVLRDLRPILMSLHLGEVFNSGCYVLSKSRDSLNQVVFAHVEKMPPEMLSDENIGRLLDQLEASAPQDLGLSRRP